MTLGWRASLCLSGVVGCHPSPATIPLPSTARSGSDVTDVLVKAPTPARAWATIADFQPALPAVDGPFECSRHEEATPSRLVQAGFPPRIVALTGYFPTAANAQATVAVTLDSTGTMLLYAERRGPPLRADRRPDMTPAEAAEALKAAIAAHRSTTISLDVRRNQAIATNTGGDGPTQSVMGRLDAAVSLEQFGKPLNRAQRVIMACRASG